MTRGIILELCPLPGFDYTRIVESIANNKPVDLSLCQVKQHGSVVDSFRDEFVEYLGQYGLSSFMRREPLIEAIIKKGEALSVVLPLLHSHLAGLSITTDLVIVDPYFFAKTNDSSYPQLVCDAIQPCLAGLKNLTIVTLPNQVDPILVASAKAFLSQVAPTITMLQKNSSSFHDRFWLNPLNSSGFITGTSLNGLGKRYALLDRIQQDDAAEVLSALKAEGVL